MEILALKNISFAYPGGHSPAVAGVSLRINAGEFVVLCGESGCGKTTLLRLLKRELSPHGKRSGEVLYCGTPLSGLSDREAASKIGFVMQNPENQVVTDKVWHELAFGLESLGTPSPVIRRRVGEMASFFGIHEWFRRETASLSGGQKQLLNLASVLCMQPDVLLLDEPTSQLDPIAAADFIAALRKLNQDLGLTILLAEHRLEDVFPLADKAAVMERGRVILYDTPEQVARSLQCLPGGHPMLQGLPSAARIYNGLNASGPCPLTVKEGRGFLSRRYKNEITALPPAPKPPAGETAVELKEAWFRYERDLPDILRGASVSVRRGECFAVLGGNGTGKTTLLRVVSGQQRAYRGQVMINGKKIKDYKGAELYRKNLVLLPQNPQDVFLKPTLEEDLEELRRPMGCSAEEWKKRVGETLTALGISHLLRRHPYDLSGGEQQKAALAKILMLEPSIILLDEPTKGLDPHARASFGKILRELAARGVTLLLVTHDVEFAAVYADRCSLFFDGELSAPASPSEFFAGNSFYTTAANRISRHMYENAVTCEDVIEICKRNGPNNA